jgi:hypothetical protein
MAAPLLCSDSPGPWQRYKKTGPSDHKMVTHCRV